MNNFDLLNLECLNYQVRRLSRMLATYYDQQMLAKTGLRYTQFTMLVNIAALDKPPKTILANNMHMDRTTVSRNLEPLVARGLVEEVRVMDGRIRHVKLTEKGGLMLEEALPIWQVAVDKLIQDVGKQTYIDTNNLVRAICAKLDCVRE